MSTVKTLKIDTDEVPLYTYSLFNSGLELSFPEQVNRNEDRSDLIIINQSASQQDKRLAIGLIINDTNFRKINP